MTDRIICRPDSTIYILFFQLSKNKGSFEEIRVTHTDGSCDLLMWFSLN